MLIIITGLICGKRKSGQKYAKNENATGNEVFLGTMAYGDKNFR